ncbi:MAG: hypothetical protein ACI9EW_000796 [Cellvibrionaceae bacterium]|jgi:uncharacterized protein YcbX
MNKIGTIHAIWIYPIKSMKGISVESADMYWYGLGGDRRYAFVQSENHSTFPWLTGREVPKIVQYQPAFANSSDLFTSSIQVTTPEGASHATTSAELRQELATQLKNPVHLMQLNRGAFDAAPMSLVSLATAKRLEDVHGANLDYRRFRINIIIDSDDQTPYCEDNWIDGSLTFGDRTDSAAILPVRPIKRCVMVNIDPDTAEKDATVLKNVIKSRDNYVGVYAWPRQVGTLKVGDPVFHRPE